MEEVYAINPDGTLKWSYLTGGQIWSTPGFAADGTVYVGSRDSKVYALNPSTGQLLSGWPQTVSGLVDSSPAIGPDGTIYIGSTAGNIYAFQPNGQFKAGWPKVTGGAVYGSPALGRDGTLYIGSLDGKLYVLNPDGTTKWTYNTGGGIRSSPAFGPEGNIYFATDGAGTVYAVNSSGTGLWTRPTGSFIDSSPAVDAFGNVIIGSWNGIVYALHPQDGTSDWTFSTGALIQSPPVLWTNGVVYIGNGAGNLYALRNVTGPARSNWPMFRQNSLHTGNPATLALASGLRLGDYNFQFQVRGLSGMNCSIEGSHNLESWSMLGSVTLPAGGTATFTDVQASGYLYRFYRVRSGSILSFNALGYTEVEIPTGLSMIANQLNNPAGGTVAILLPNPPSGTTLQKWNETTQGFDLNTFSGGAWSIPNLTLNPGEGVFVQPGSATAFTFIGAVPQGPLANPFPSGDSIRSSMVPQTGPIDTLLGLPLINNDVIYRYDNAAASLVGYSYYSDGQSHLWVPEAPVPRVGESFWIRTTSARTWTRSFTVW